MDFNNLKTIDRVRIPESRNIQEGLCMNRNERVEAWDQTTIQAVLNTIHPKQWNLYHSLESTYNKLSRFYNVDVENMLLLNGAEDGILKCFHVFIKEGSNVGILDPTYAMYYIFSKSFKCNLHKISYSVNKHNIKLDKEHLLSILPSLDIIFLANPNHILDNLTKEDIVKICNEAKKTNTIVVIDEVAAGFGVYRSRELIHEHDNLLVINSFSKEFGLPSIRSGILFGNKTLIKACCAIRFSYEISLFSKKFIEYIIDNYKIVSEYNQKVIKGREYFLRVLDENLINYNSDNSICVNIYIDDLNKKKFIYEKLLENKVYIKNYTDTSFSGKFKHFFTVTMAPIDTMKCFLDFFLKYYKDYKSN